MKNKMKYPEYVREEMVERKNFKRNHCKNFWIEERYTLNWKVNIKQTSYI